MLVTQQATQIRRYQRLVTKTKEHLGLKALYMASRLNRTKITAKAERVNALFWSKMPAVSIIWKGVSFPLSNY